MNKAQKAVVITCSLLALGMILFVPIGIGFTYGRIIPRGFSPIFLHSAGYVVNYTQLIIQLVVLAAAGTGLFFMVKAK